MKVLDERRTSSRYVSVSNCSIVKMSLLIYLVSGVKDKIPSRGFMRLRCEIKQILTPLCVKFSGGVNPSTRYSVF
mgnify:CR=1 FL=1